jgi:hypothetical protein
MSAGEHTVLVRAWDNSGAFGDQTLSITAKALKPTVTVLTPTNHANVGSPVNIQASCSPTAGQTITGWKIYVDSVAAYTGGPVNEINASVGMHTGSRTVLVRAWDTSGGYGDQTLTLTVSSKPAVTVSAPAIGSNVLSPIKIQASATPSSGHSITGWAVYLDGSDAYRAGAVTSISPSVSASTGTHTVVVRAWDSSAAFGDQTFTIEVQHVAVNISAPADGASVTSPVNLNANAASGHSITGWQVYVDTIPWFGQGSGSQLNADLGMSPGTHTVLVRAWDSTGAYGDETIKVTVP